MYQCHLKAESSKPFMTTQIKLTDMFNKISENKADKQSVISNKEIIQLKGKNVEKLKAIQKAERFLSELTRKCNSFIEYATTKDVKLLGQQIWKNEALLYAVQAFPRFNHEELQRLVDRDWKYMGEEERQKILNQFNTFQYQTIEQQVKQLQAVLARKRQSKTG